MINSLKLNKEQINAVNTLNGNLLILASAGTGKTTTIVERYVNLVENHGFSPNEIMMTTFTNKAAKDMVEKIRKRTHKKLNNFQKNGTKSLSKRKYAEGRMKFKQEKVCGGKNEMK